MRGTFTAQVDGPVTFANEQAGQGEGKLSGSHWRVLGLETDNSYK